ncbi:hypothetical protein CVT26_010999 [Gymnopilus dilepis]|uniref:ATP-dependent DNA helicase n=1 Tax=Gymnopilus dilepis TaxID=231916 RepID=A0A409VYB2_9AGAR|nr:hypothetical protein CVT26_010999 [Gymnopilus dilepis]
MTIYLKLFHDLTPSLIRRRLYADIVVKHFTTLYPMGVIASMNVVQFNACYRFYSVSSELSAVAAFVSDPNCLVISVDIRFLIYWYRFFLLSELRTLCKSHGMRVGRETKGDLCGRMHTHICSTRCSGYVYIFKSRPFPRTGVARHFGIVDPAFDHFVFGLYTSHASGQITRVDSDREERESFAVSNMTDDDDGDRGHLTPCDYQTKLAIVKEWEVETSAEKLGMVVCASCSKRIPRLESVWVAGDSIPLHLLRNEHLPDHLLPRSYDLDVYEKALLNPKGLEFTSRLGCIRLCLRCRASLSAGKMPKFALSNWLYYGREVLPDAVREAFDKSTLFERMLICRARCNSITCKFNLKQSDARSGPGAEALNRERKGIRGNIMVAPLDVFKLNNAIPPHKDMIKDTMCAVFVGNRMPTRSTLSKYRPVLVRKSRVKLLIEFLIGNNYHYRPSVTFRFSQRNLDDLFDGEEDQGVPASAHIGYIPLNDAIDVAVSDYTSRNRDQNLCEVDDDDEFLMENVGYTEGDDSPMSYQAMKDMAIQRCLLGKPFLVSGKGSRGVPDFFNPSIMTWLFPHLDPWGIGGFYHPGRLQKISMHEQLAHLLMVDDSPFERDPEFAVNFHNIGQKGLVSRTLRFGVSRQLHRGIVTDFLSIDPEVLVELYRKCEKDPRYIPREEKEKKAFATLSSLRLIARHLPGSDGYKTMLRNEIRSLILYRRTPTLFVTLNPSDVDHPLVRIFAGEDISLDDMMRGEDMSEWQRKLFAARNPSACARFFDFMITRFINIILRYGRDSPGLYGKCVAYYGVVEAQGKGTLHCHMLIWLEGHLSPQKLRDRMAMSSEYQTDVFRWLESVIQCEFPGVDMTEGQLRKYPRRLLHKETGDPHPGAVCNPRTASYQDDEDAFWMDFSDTLIRLLHQYNWHEHQATCWKYLERGDERSDANCRLGMDGQTRDTTEVDPETFAILLRRRHPKIAAHTELVTFLMQCNMDIKFVGSGDAAKAFLYYLTDYLTKSLLPVHVAMSVLSYAVKNTHEKLPDGMRDLSENQAIGAVTTAVNSMMGRHEISQPQVMSYLVGGGDHYKSDKFVKLSWGSIRKYVETRSSSRGQDDPGMVSVALGNLTAEVSYQLFDYVYRSRDPKFDGLSLYDFVALSSKARYKPDHDVEVIHPGGFIGDEHPQRHTHYLTLRRERHVPVILGPKIPNPERSSEQRDIWSRDVLTLFKPWRSVNDLKKEDESWTEAFDTYRASLDDISKIVIANLNVLTECAEARDRHPHRARRRRPDDECEIPPVGLVAEAIETMDMTDAGSFDPFYEFDGESEEVAYSIGGEDILSSDISSMLDSCLPLTMEELGPADDLLVCPTLVGDGDREMLAEQSAAMIQKRKRKLADVAQTEDADGRRKRRRVCRDGSPIAVRATLSNDPEVQSTMSATIQSVVDEMNLKGNDEQMAAFMTVARHAVDRSAEQLLMYVAGVGGTGKSHVIRSIVRLFDRLDRSHELVLGAPTGIAAVLIDGQTLHSLIFATPNSKSRDIAALTRLWMPIKYLIVDEVSMVGARFLSQLSSRIRQGKGDDLLNSGKPFGGVNVIFTGDFAQLKPPKQFALYAHELVRNQSFAQASNERGISAMNGAFLWRQVHVAVELVRNQRQSEDPVYASFLARLRLGQCDAKPPPGQDLNDLDYLRTRLMENLASNAGLMAEFKDAPIIVGSKALRDLLTAKLVRYHARRNRTELMVFHSKDYVSKKLTVGDIRRRLWRLPSSVNKEAFGRLPLFIGMKVMVTENLAFDNGIVNGSEGVVQDIKYDEDDQGIKYARVAYVLFPGCGVRMDGLEDDVVPIFPVTTRIEHSNLQSLAGSKSFSRSQLPLVPAYVYTDFKSQGRTLTRVIVDLFTARGQGVYVMLSRVKSLDGLLILRRFPPSKVYHRLPQELRDELTRLKGIDLEVPVGTGACSL